MIKRVLLVAAVAAVALASAADFNATEPRQGCILGTLAPCNSQPARGLADQIMRELNNMGYSFVNTNSQWIRCSGGCTNVLQSVAHNALVNAAKNKVNSVVEMRWNALKYGIMRDKHGTDYCECCSHIVFDGHI